MGKINIFHGYIVVITAFVIMMMIWGTWATFGIFFERLTVEFHWSRAAISGANALNNLIFGVVCIFSAGLSDKIGVRKVILVCSIILGISYLLMARIESLWEIYVYFGMFAALGMSSYIPILSLVARWFARRRGMMTGIVFSGMGLGTMVMPLVVNQLISVYQWRTAFVIMAGISLVLTVIASLFIKAAPADDEIEHIHEAEKQVTTHTANLTLRGAMRTGQFALLCLLYFCFLFCLVTIMVHVVIHATDLGIAAADAAAILAIIGGACIVGMNVIGSVSDRADMRLVTGASFAMMALSLAWLLFAGTVFSLYIFAIVFGFAYGGIQTLFSPLVARLFGLRSHGLILGAAAFIGTFGAVIGPIAAGYIFDSAGNYSLAFVLCALLAGSGVIAAYFLRAMRAG